MGRHANPDIRRAYAEFQDADTPSKCNKVRCLHCGYVRAKNTTRQIEHLQECQAFLASPEAQAHILEQQQQQQQQQDRHAQPGGTPGLTPVPSQILNGQHPNPNLQVHRRGPHNKRGRDGQPIAPTPPAAPQYAPSLTSHLLTICSAPFTQATQQPFLSHAGCGSLAIGPCALWLAQDAHLARGYIRFIGQLLGKMRLPHAQNSQFHPMYRTMDLLISALNNTRREMQFFEITATKYGLPLGNEPPSPITRSLLDLFVSTSSASASLLEGMVALWTAQHCYRSAWQYAHSFSTSLPTPSSDAHTAALHQALIPNWISPAFSKFVDATRSLVDELANITTTRDGKEEMLRCEEIFRQICWLKQRFWPNVDSMVEETESSRLGGTIGPSMPPGPRGPPHSVINGPISGISGPSMGGISNMNNNMNVPMAMRGPLNNGPMSAPRNNGLPSSRPMNPASVNDRPLNPGPSNSGSTNWSPINVPSNSPGDANDNDEDNEEAEEAEEAEAAEDAEDAEDAEEGDAEEEEDTAKSFSAERIESAGPAS